MNHSTNQIMLFKKVYGYRKHNTLPIKKLTLVLLFISVIIRDVVAMWL
jgi:hypothetical protein